jgi:hypothetical protein
MQMLESNAKTLALMKSLEKLWSIADKEAENTKREFPLVFDPIGLMLFRPLKEKYYDSTPVNSFSFAQTGGDGVHFSLVVLEGRVSEDSPVVMTVPMNYGKVNLIVGENLIEFLSLGGQLGYFFLEQLIYNEEKTIEWLLHPKEFISKEYGTDPSGPFPPESFREQERLLSLLREAFELKPWSRLKSHLDELQNRFMGMLELRT